RTRAVRGGGVGGGGAGGGGAGWGLGEEPGCGGGGLVAMGEVNPTPALFTNRVLSFCVRGVEPVGAIQNDAREETVVELVPLADLDRRLRAGDIRHALVVAALHWFRLTERER